MHDDLAKYFDRLDARAIDPNETIEVDGRSRRVIDLHKAGQRKRHNKKYRDKDRAAERGRTAAWKDANPDKVLAQKNRAGDRHYHRPFIGVDAEGQDFGGEPVMASASSEPVAPDGKRAAGEGREAVEYFMLEGDIEYRGNIYPLHRTILWGAGGWQRLHTSTEIAKKIGLPHLGKSAPRTSWVPRTSGRSAQSILSSGF